jgi:hypothetical protein
MNSSREDCVSSLELGNHLSIRQKSEENQEDRV